MALHESGENYLVAVMLLERTMGEGNVHSADTARYRKVSRASVCCGMNALKSDGYIVIDEKNAIHLTGAGRKVAKEIDERHLFFADMLMNAGVSSDVAERDACRLEHVISRESFMKLKSKIHDILLT